MSPHRRLRFLIIVPAAVLTVITGCSAGQQAATAEQSTQTAGAGGDAGEIAVRDAQIVFEGPIPGDEVHDPGADAPLQVTILNTGERADTLTGVDSPVASTVEVDGETRMPGGQALVAGYDDPIASITLADAEAVRIVLVDLTEPLRAGLTYPVTFSFERAGAVTLELPLENPDRLPPRAETEPADVAPR